jgi:hypothetical protein
MRSADRSSLSIGYSCIPVPCPPPPQVLSLGSAQILKALVNSQHLVRFASPEQA